MENNINEGLEDVENWSKMNKMIISQTKTKSVLVVGRRLRKRSDSTEANLNLPLNGAIIELVKSLEPLGIHIDQDLDFDAQSDAPCKSLSLDYLYSIGPLQLAIHVTQNRRAGEQKSHWDKTNKENYNLKLCMSFV